MNISNLRSILETENIPQEYYCLSGGLAEDMNTIQSLPNGKWEVYYTERGVRYKVKVFDTESEACEELLRRIRSMMKHL